jgi:HD-GYP domain-containing protein (c-di-GMP phosphodiesterase class II)
MSSDRQSDVRSSGPEQDGAGGSTAGEAAPTPQLEPGLAAVVGTRGATLLDGLERHLPGSSDHADGTASYAFATAVELGLERGHAEAVREIAGLHEMGKVYVPAAVLAKLPGELTPEESAQFDSHFAKGAELARGAGIPEPAAAWIEAAGERFDGAGPGGLLREQIPLESRIVRAACAFDGAFAAVAAAPPAERRRAAIEELRSAAGSELDPRVVETLASIVERAASRTGPLG